MLNSRSTINKATLSLAALALVGTATLAPVQTATADEPATPAQDCKLVNEQLVVEAEPNVEMTSKFSEYGNTSGSWVGGDSTYSVALKDGRIAWLFSDTLLGTVVDNAITRDTLGFINQSIVLQEGDDLTTTIPTGESSTLTSMFPPPDPSSWYWLGAGYQAPNGKLFIGLNQYTKFGPGLWDWGWDHTAIGTIDPKTWTVTDVAHHGDDSNVQWTSWFERAEGKTYVWGVDDQGALKQAHLARVAGHDLSRIDKWEYWTGTEWSKDPSASEPVLDHVANEYSVTKFRDGYLLVTQDTSEMFSTKVVAYTSCSLTGPFVNKTVLFNTPETGLFGSYGDPNIFTYNAHVHPEFSDDDSLLVSYNVNTFDNEHVFDDVTIYRPRFWTVTVA